MNDLKGLSILMLLKDICIKICTVIFFIAIPFFLSAQNEEIDSLNALLSGISDSPEKIELLNNIAELYQQTDLDKSIHSATQALDLAETLDYSEGKAQSLLLLGSAYMNLGLNDRAIIYLSEALNYFIRIQDAEGVNFTYNSLGNVYWFLEEHKLALEYYKKTRTYYEQVSDTTSLISCYLNIALSYYSLNEKDSADYFIDISLQYSEDQDNDYTTAMILLNKASFYFENKEFFESSIILSTIENDYLGLLHTGAKGNFYGLYSNYYIKEENYEKAEEYLLKLYELADKSQSKLLLRYYYNTKYELNTAKGNYKEAVTNLENYNLYQDSIIDFNYKRKIENLEKLHEVEKKESEIQLLKTENLYKDTLLKQNRIRSRLYILISFLLLFIGAVIFRAERIRKKRNELLRIKNTDLLDLNTQKDKFNSIISHDLRGSIGTIKGFADVILSRYNTLSDEKKQLFLTQISQAGESTLNLLNNLLDWSRAQQGKVTYNPEKINVCDMVSNVQYFVAPMAEKKRIKILNEIETELFANGDKGMIFTVLRNLISNAIKFTSRGGQIQIYAEENSGIYKIHVKDNGVGMRQDVYSKIFESNHIESNPGTEHEKGTGMGLMLCKEFIDYHEQNIGVTSKLGIGSDFWFTLEAIKPASYGSDF